MRFQIKRIWFSSNNYLSESECLKYKVLDSANRSITHQLQPGSTPSCDYNLHHTWYRFLSPEGNRLASSCVPIGRCGTVVTGYLSSNPPQMTDGIVGGDVSFHFRSNCSMWSQRIQVRNCGRFLVYKLNAPRGCPMRFCTYQAGKISEIYSSASLQPLF